QRFIRSTGIPAAYHASGLRPVFRLDRINRCTSVLATRRTIGITPKVLRLFPRISEHAREKSYCWLRVVGCRLSGAFSNPQPTTYNLHHSLHSPEKTSVAGPVL